MSNKNYNMSPGKIAAQGSRQDADRIDVDTWISLIENDPEKYCTNCILASVSERNGKWMEKLSRKSLEYVLEYLRGLGGTDKFDYTVIQAVVRAYRDGCYADVIKEYGYIQLQKAFHDDIVSCLGQHYDTRWPDEYMSSRLRVCDIEGLEDTAELAEIASEGDDMNVCRRAADKIDAETWTELIEREPEKYINRYILESVSRKNDKWMKKLSRRTLESILTYMRGLGETENIDYSIAYAVIIAYRDGHCADLIKSYGDISLQRGGYVEPCVGTIYHGGGYWPHVSLGDKL